MTFPDHDLTRDDFLGGRISVLQPRTGYRAATDPVFLAASIQAKPGERVLELGCGAGTALACLCARVPGVEAHGLEVQPEYAALARRNAEANGSDFKVWEGDLTAMPAGLKELSFDHVFANPPFYPPTDATAPEDSGRAVAHVEGHAGLDDWIAAALRRAKPKAYVSIIHRTERLGDILCALQTGAGDIRVLPITPRSGRPAGRVIVRGRKAARGPLSLLPPFVVHEGNSHAADGDDYSTLARNILREMRELSI